MTEDGYWLAEVTSGTICFVLAPLLPKIVVEGLNVEVHRHSTGLGIPPEG
jgi:hypothetical protein